jgi:MFS family permease
VQAFAAGCPGQEGWHNSLVLSRPRGPFRGLPREVPVLTAVSFTVALGYGIVAPAIPEFARQFGVSAAAAAGIAVVALPDRPYGRIAGVRASRPLAALARALRSRAYRAAASATFADGFAALGVRSAIVPLFVRDVLHRSAVWTGIGFLVFAVLNAAAVLPGGRAADALGRRPRNPIAARSGIAMSRCG